jgi:hypothetical protein
MKQQESGHLQEQKQMEWQAAANRYKQRGRQQGQQLRRQLEQQWQQRHAQQEQQPAGPQQAHQQQQQQQQQQRPEVRETALPRLHEAQNGFRPKGCCADQQFVLNQVVSGRKLQGKDTYLLFVDTYKAFPTVWLDGLFHKLWEQGVRGKMFRVLYNLYQGASRVVSHEGCVTDRFSCDLGLHEGDVISPTLYLVDNDDLLREVHAKHPGVTLLGPCGEPAGEVVAAMQADDFVAVCGSLSDVQAVAMTVHDYCCTWRFRLNSLKSAVMHVMPGGEQSRLVYSGIVWDGVPVPVVSEYCYLGLWFNNTFTWGTHFNKMLEKVQRVKSRLMPIWKSRQISVEVKRIVLLSCVRPIIEYGAEVWFPSNVSQWNTIDKVQTDIIKCAMRCGKEKPCSLAVLAEWAVKPMHMWLHQRAMEYYFRVLSMPETRLPKQVFVAEWKRPSGAVAMLPWQKYVHCLLCKYGVNVTVASSGAAVCKNHLKQQVALTHADKVVQESTNMSTLHNYITNVHPRHADSMRFKVPRPFLCVGGPSHGVELMMRVRLGCLCVHERTSRFGGRRANHNTACPACHAPVESLSHFMFECPATSSFRDHMFDGIRQFPGCAERLRACLAMSNATVRVSRFVSDDLWGGREVAVCVSGLIAEYLVQAWGLRNGCKHNGAELPLPSAPVGRGADGDVAMA